MKRFEDKYMIMDSMVDITLEIVHGVKTKESIQKFTKICNTVVEMKDPLCAYIFARGVSHHLDKDYQKFFNVKKFEKIVVNSRDEDLIYGFGKDVKGADLHCIYHNLTSDVAKEQIKQDMQML